MKSYKNLAINSKLTLLALMAGGIALTLSTICFVTNDISMIRSTMVKQVSTLATVIGGNSTAALEFQDQDEANKLLASLQNQPAVEIAAIYAADGSPFAMYHRSGDAIDAPPTPTKPGYQFTNGGHLEIVQHIQHDGQLNGQIYIRANANEIYQQITRYIAIVAVVMIVSLGTALLFAARMQRAIATPIVNLAATAQRISLERNYSLRVTKSADDELGALYDEFNAMLDQIQRGEAAIQRANDELELKIEQRTAELSRANKDLSHEVFERVKAEKELESTHQKLMDAARRAGMAEIATGVLHNVGNVLNSINVSATLVADRIRQSKVSDLNRVIQMLEKNKDVLGTFITTDPKGKQIPGFLGLLATHLSDERSDIASELELLTGKVAHVKAIVATQQSYAGVSGVIESVDLSTTLDDAMKLNVASFERHKISIVKEYSELPKIRLDKQKVLQILVNLIKNAKEALSDAPNTGDRKITVRTLVRDKNRLQILVMDNGVGIREEDLTRIFSHGFTTKKTGHGFGLHSCANAANELGGSLTATSEGPGHGAAFVLEIPYEPIELPVQV